MAHYNTVFHTLAKILPRHGIDRQKTRMNIIS